MRKHILAAPSHLTLTSVVRCHGPSCPLGDIWPSLETFLAVPTREGRQQCLVGGGQHAAQHFRVHMAAPPNPHPSTKNNLLKMSVVPRPRSPAVPVAEGSARDGE